MQTGKREILEKNKYIIGTDFLGESGLPTINVVQYPLGPLIQIRGLDMIVNPCYYMILNGGCLVIENHGCQPMESRS